MRENNGRKTTEPIKKLLSSAAVLLILLAAALPANAREAIRAYDVEIRINKDSSMTVTENITAAVENREINKGIIRTFPVEYKDKKGRRVRVGFEVLEAKIDGKPTKVSIASEGRNKEARIGDPNRTLTRGDHTFTITYETTRQLGFFEDYDELYWNVTGNDWAYPILSASCSVKLPNRNHGEGFDTIEWYSGSYGQKGNAADAMLLPDGTVKTTRALAAGEGLTVVFTWPKGLVTPPPPLPYDNLAGRLSAVTVTFILILAWLLFARNKLRREQDEKAVIPLFHPPNGASPAFTRYIYTFETDNVSLSAAIIGLAVKGALKIQEKNGGTITLIKEPEEPDNLLPEETPLMHNLFGDGSSLELRQQESSRQRLRGAIRALIMYMKKSKYGLIDLNTSYILPAVALYALGAAGLCFYSPESRTPALAVSFVGGAVIIAGVLNGKKPKGGAFSTRQKPLAKRAVSVLPEALIIGAAALTHAFVKTGARSILKLLGATAASAAGAVLFIYREYLMSGTLVPFILLLCSAELIAFMRPRLISYTAKGAGLAREVEGLRLYMNTAEKDRLEMLNPPEETPQLFERLLPYALALGVAKTWGDRFAKILQNAQYVPVWYSGPSPHVFMDGRRLNSFSSKLERQVAGSMRSPDSAPGSSSGSSRSGGGGGFSGGGGGGGGGRGW